MIFSKKEGIFPLFFRELLIFKIVRLVVKRYSPKKKIKNKMRIDNEVIIFLFIKKNPGAEALRHLY
jgi:hypothetical protein